MNTPATRQTSEPIDFTASQVCQSLLETTLRTGAQQMLQQAIEAEVANYLRQHREQLDEQGHRLVVGNGHLPARQVQTGMGVFENPYRSQSQMAPRITRFKKREDSFSYRVARARFSLMRWKKFST